MKTQTSIRILIIAFSILILFFSGSFSRTWYIKPDGNGDAPTIQAGVDSAAAGDTVFADAGTYTSIVEVMTGKGTRNAAVHLYKNVCLIGDGSATTTIAGTGGDIGVFASGVDTTALIRGFTVRSRGGNSGCPDLATAAQLPAYTAGIWCETSSIRVEECKITQNDRGLYLLLSPVIVSDCEFVNDDFAVVCENGSDASIAGCTIHYCWGFFMCHGSSPSLIGNRLFDSCEGLLFDGTSHPYLSGNRITAGAAMISGYGPAAVFLQSGGTVENNEILATSVGVWVNSSDTATKIIRNNLFVLNMSGVWAQTSNVVIENNTFDDNGFAIECVGDSETLLRNNIISGGSVGIRCTEQSEAIVSCNNIFGCTNARYVLCPDQTGINGNISMNPQFCGIKFSGNYFLQNDSPCAPGNHPDGIDCGLIGALPVNCGTTDVKKNTWGRIKAIYKK